MNTGLYFILFNYLIGNSLFVDAHSHDGIYYKLGTIHDLRACSLR